MKIQFIVQQKSGISYHRIVNPISYLDLGENWEKELLWFKDEEHKIDCDILWYNKFTSTEPKLLKALKKKGTKIVVDVDDSWDLPTSHPHYKQWVDGKYPQRVIDHLKLADVVICTTLRLQDKVREYNKNTVVIPNAFPYGHENYQSIKQAPHEKMGFIYVAGSTHLPDVELLRGKFKRIGSDSYIKNNAEFILAGYEPSYSKQFFTQQDMMANNENFGFKKIPGIWDKMSSIFSQTNSYKIIPTADLDEYINHYDLADVVLVPLKGTEWDSYKSELKILEAACKKLPVICSSVLPYSELRPCEGIMWVERPDDWIDYVKYCLKNPGYVKEQGAKLAEWVWEEYDLIKWNEVRKQLINTLVK